MSSPYPSSLASALGPTAVWCSAMLVGTSARAEARSTPVDTEITSDTTLQFYDVRSPSSNVVIARRRHVSTVGVAAYNLTKTPEAARGGPEFLFRARVRYDADYGGGAFETDPRRPDALVPGLERERIDLMYGYVEGRRMFGGAFSFRLGRQYIVDSLGWWSFDGALLRATTPAFVQVESYVGFEQRGGLPFSTGRFEGQGVWRGARPSDGSNAELYPSFLAAEPAPAVGAAVESTGPAWLHARASYRRVANTGEIVMAPYPGSPTTEPLPVSSGPRTSQERIGGSLTATHDTLGTAHTQTTYDLYLARITQISASLDVWAAANVTLGLAYDYLRPSFDGDSIWNSFFIAPLNDVSARMAWEASRTLSVAGSIHGRAWGDMDAGADASSSRTSDSLAPLVGGDASLRMGTRATFVGARSAVDVHPTARRLGSDLYAETSFERRFVTRARVGLWDWSDSLRRGRDATSVGSMIGLGYRTSPQSLFMTEVSHDANRLVGHRFRVLVSFSVNLGNP